jgi:serine/threonine protein kinase
MTNSTAQQSPTAREIGRYHLVAELARGGMGNVYLAVTQGPGGFSKLVVIKELKPELSDDETYVSMFLDEARLAARLSHPNIVQTNEVGSEGKRQYMVMEFLDGRSLHRIHKHLGIRFPVGAHLRVISEALMGLHHAHEMREFDGDAMDIVHRDVSPLNVFVTFAGQAKVLDFGIAKTVDSSFETKMGVLKGRVAYMAPEQAKGGKVDRRADVYSAGVMIWEAAAGRRLWPKMSEVEILTELLGDGAPTLRSVQPNAPKDLERICARAMAFNRDERYGTAADLLQDLETHLARRSDAMPMREVGALVAHVFTDERRKMNAVIDEALTRVRGGPRSGVMPTFQAQVAGTPSNARLVASELGSFSQPMFTPGSSFVPPTGVSTLASLSHSAPATSATVGSLAAIPQFRPWTSKRVAVFASLGGALLVGAIVFGAALRGDRSAAQAPAAVAFPLPAAVRAEPELVDLSVRVSPPSAQITIDGASVSSNPLRARYPKDTQMHHIVATAEGYEPKSADVSFASDVSIDVSLNRRANVPLHQGVSLPFIVPAGHPAKHGGSAPQASGATVSDPIATPSPVAVPRIEVSPGGGRAPLRPIATSNPYGNP